MYLQFLVFFFFNERFSYEINQEQEHTVQQIEKLKTELLDTKKESKKRRRMLETQQRMLMAQNSNYHSVN